MRERRRRQKFVCCRYRSPLPLGKSYMLGHFLSLHAPWRRTESCEPMLQLATVLVRQGLHLLVAKRVLHRSRQIPGRRPLAFLASPRGLRRPGVARASGYVKEAL